MTQRGGIGKEESYMERKKERERVRETEGERERKTM